MNKTMRGTFYQYVIPSMLAFALSGVYSIVDGFFVGNSIGDHGLAAINMAYPLTALIQSAGTGISMGGAVQYSICDGAGEHKKKYQYFSGSMILLLAASFLLTAVILAGGPTLLKLFGARGEIFDLGAEYIRFIALGTIFQMFGTGLVPFIRNMGGVIAAMAAMIAGFVTNMILDYVLVWVLPYGIVGAAVATVIGQAVTLAVCLGYLLLRKTKVLVSIKDSWKSVTKEVLLVAISPFGLAFSPNITLILVNRSAATYGGDQAVTTYATISYVAWVVLALLQGISDGCQPLLSICHGEGDQKKVRQIRNMGYRFAAAVSLVCMGMLYLIRYHVALLFGASLSTVENTGQVLPVFIAGFLFICFARVTTAYFYATAKNVLAYLVIYGESFLLFVFLMICPTVLGITGTWVSVPLSQIAVMLLSVFLLSCLKKKSGNANVWGKKS